MQMIGNDLYVHAGLGKDFYDKNLTFPTVNEEMSKGAIYDEKRTQSAFPHSQPSKNSGPIWYHRTGTPMANKSAGKTLK